MRRFVDKYTGRLILCAKRQPVPLLRRLKALLSFLSAPGPSVFCSAIGLGSALALVFMWDSLADHPFVRLGLLCMSATMLPWVFVLFFAFSCDRDRSKRSLAFVSLAIALVAAGVVGAILLGLAISFLQKSTPRPVGKALTRRQGSEVATPRPMSRGAEKRPQPDPKQREAVPTPAEVQVREGAPALTTPTEPSKVISDEGEKPAVPEKDEPPSPVLEPFDEASARPRDEPPREPKADMGAAERAKQSAPFSGLVFGAGWQDTGAAERAKQSAPQAQAPQLEPAIVPSVSARQVAPETGDRGAAPRSATEGRSDQQELKHVLNSMRKRYPALSQYKADKSIGENRNGYVVERSSSKMSYEKYAKGVREIIAAENADRLILYQARARMDRTTAENVAPVYAKGWRDVAERGEWIEVLVGEKWVWTEK